MGTTIIKFVSDSLERGELWIVGVVFLLFAVFNFNRILDEIDKLKYRKLSHIEKYMNSEFPPGSDVKKTFQQVSDALLFKSAVGIYAEDRFRKSLIDFYEESTSEITWLTIHRAASHLYEKEGELTVQLSNYEKIGFYYNLASGAFFLISAMFFLLFGFFSNPGTVSAYLNIILLVVVFLALSIWTIREAASVTCAKKIKKELVRIQEDK